MGRTMKRSTIMAGLTAITLLGGCGGNATCKSPATAAEVRAESKSHSFPGLEGMTARYAENHPEIDLEKRIMPMYYTYRLPDSTNLRDYFVPSEPGNFTPRQSVAWVGGLFPDNLEAIATEYTPEKGLSLLSKLRSSDSWNEITSNTTANPRRPESVRYDNLRLNGRPLYDYLNGDAQIRSVPLETISISDRDVLEEYSKAEYKMPPIYREGAGKESMLALFRITMLTQELRIERANSFPHSNPSMEDVSPDFFLPVGSSRHNGVVEFKVYRITYQEPNLLKMLLDRGKR